MIHEYIWVNLIFSQCFITVVFMALPFQKSHSGPVDECGCLCGKWRPLQTSMNMIIGWLAYDSLLISWLLYNSEEMHSFRKSYFHYPYVLAWGWHLWHDSQKNGCLIISMIREHSEFKLMFLANRTAFLWEKYFFFFSSVKYLLYMNCCQQRSFQKRNQYSFLCAASNFFRNLLYKFYILLYIPL